MPGSVLRGAGVGRLVEDVRPVFEAPGTEATPSYLDLAIEAAQRTSPLPYDNDWSQARNDNVTAMWQTIFGLDGHPPDQFGEGPAGVAMSFGASTDPAPVEPQAPETSTPSEPA
ncbi:MAG: hypothetical protein GY720_16010 [bacterium]|nr:hypothetical protein [bacterium]MCP4223894.1 hypothetical protein [Actinomycetes bacterium]MCP5032532.1 hypothetical protein [Actinomycetes bacterium]